MEQKQGKKSVLQSVLLLGVITSVLVMPLFIVLYKYFPEITLPFGEEGFRLDHIILFLLLFFIVYFMLVKIRIIVYGLIILGLVGLTITNFSGIYTLTNLYHDYAQLLYDLSENSLEQKFAIENGQFKKEKELKSAIDYTSPELRNYASSAAVKHFDEVKHLSQSLKWVQFFSVFKEIHAKWKYVYDPINEDYYSMASQTLKQLTYDDFFKGDCDDYSIMMAACIKSIGGSVRLVRTEIERNGKTIGHMYPEVKFGDSKDLETVVYLIKNIYFDEESKGRAIYYYEDSKGFIWLNFDYNDAYPGGRYQSDFRKSAVEI